MVRRVFALLLMLATAYGIGYADDKNKEVVINATAGGGAFHNKVVEYNKKLFRNEALVFEEGFLDELAGYILSRDKVPGTKLEGQGELLIASRLLKYYLYRKYGETRGAVEKNLSGRMKEAFHLAERNTNLLEGDRFGLYVCANGDEAKAKQLKEKISETRKKFDKYDILHKPGQMKKEDRIAIYEEIDAICKYTSYRISLMRAYRDNGQYDKHARLMVQIVKDDQTAYNYFHDDYEEKYWVLFDDYADLLAGLTKQNNDEKFHLSNEDIVSLIEDVVTKHRDFFDFTEDHYRGYAGYEIFAKMGLNNLIDWSIYLGRKDLTDKLAEIVMEEEKKKPYIYKDEFKAAD